MKLRVLPNAEAEIRNVAKWYDDQRPGLREQFISELNRVFESIERFPESYSPLESFQIPGTDLRRCNLAKFPYSVIFELTPDEVHVVAVGHFNRRPGYWLGQD